MTVPEIMPSTQMSCDYDTIGDPSQSENNPAAKYMPDSSSEHSDNPSESSSFTAPARPNLTFFGSEPPCKTCLFPRPVTTSTIISQLPIGDLRYKPTPPTRSAYLRKRSSVGYRLKFTVTTQHRPPYSHTPKPERSQRYEHQ
jgi:hypothetical protein